MTRPKNFLKTLSVLAVLDSKRPYLWIGLAVLAVYGQTLFFDFTYLDDYILIVENSIFMTYAPNLWKVFQHDFISVVSGGYYYRPLLAFSLIANAVVAGQNPFLFHLTDVVLHAAVCMLLYRVLRLIFEKPSTALLGALIYAVHPVLVQTVAWIPARNDTLVTLFILWYVLCFAQRKYLWAALAMAAGLASKETAVMIPFISLYYTWFMAVAADKWKTLLKMLPIWAVLISAWYLGRSILIAHDQGVGIGEAVESIYLSSAAIVDYLGKIILPVNLSTYPVMADVRLYFGAAALALLALGFLLSKQKRYGVILFGLGWFFTFLLPSLVRPNAILYSEILEHRVYLPFIGILIFVLEFDWFKKDWLAEKRTRIAAYAALVIMAIINISHASNFSGGLKYWKKAVASSPSSSFAHKQVGVLSYLAGDKQTAETEYHRAIALNGEETLVQANLGLIYTEAGRYKEAENLYLREIAVNPEYDKVYFNLGHLYWMTNRKAEAAENWQRTLERNPYHFLARHNLAIYFYEQGRFAEGAAQLLEIANRGGQIDPVLLQNYRPYLPR